MLRLVAVLATAAALQPKSIHLIVNPTGGSKSGLDILDKVLPAFEAAGVDVAVQRTEYAGHAEQLAKTLEPRDAPKLSCESSRRSVLSAASKRGVRRCRPRRPSTRRQGCPDA